MTKQEHLAHLENRLTEAKACDDQSMIEMISLKINNMRGAAIAKVSA